MSIEEGAKRGEGSRLTPSSLGTFSASAIIRSRSSVLPISRARNLNLEHREARGSMMLREQSDQMSEGRQRGDRQGRTE